MLKQLLHRVRYSLKYRIAAIIFLLEAGMMGAVLGVTLRYSQAETEKRLEANEQVMHHLLGNLSRIALLTSEYDELQPYIEEVVMDPHVNLVLVADRRGRVVVSNDHAMIGNPLPTVKNNENYRWLTREIFNSSGSIGALAIRFSHEQLMQTSRDVRNLGISIALVGMTIIAIVGILIGHLLTRRLDVLTTAAQRLAKGDLDARTWLAGHDEVAIVGQAFDTMARNVAYNVEALKRATDLLEQRVAERTRELAVLRDEAVAANRSKGAFLANMSHEIRTPLTAIIGFSESLLDSKQPIAERIDAIRTIIRSGNHLLRIINDILDVSKVDADKIEIESILVNPFEILEDVEAIVSLLAEDKGLQFEIEYLYPLPTQITSDPLRLKQILINLCNNAIKFTERGAVRIQVGCDPQLETLTFKVIDTGIGMTPQTVGQLFQAFTQADASTTREYGGTGLGLYLSKQLAVRLGGDIVAESTPDVGSRFTLTVRTGPLASGTFITTRPANVMKLVPSPTTEISVTGHVLLAEDNIDNQKLVSLLLRRSGAEVSIAENGQLAVDMALLNPYDLILMDMQMPVMNGLEATRTLRQRGYRGAIVALTANATREDVESCLAAGCDDFMSKPIDRQKLYENLARQMPRSRIPAHDRGPIASHLLEMDPGLLDLVTEFVERLPAVSQEIASAFQTRDFPDLKLKVHSLKGSAGNFGYPELHKLCQRLEFELATANEPAIADLLQEMGELVELIGSGLPGHTPHPKERTA
jgi:signal transduction histidine kinase/DNA-binding NarL/FixJ family response regulator